MDLGFGVGMVCYDVSGTTPVVEWAEAIVNAYRTVIFATLNEHVPDLEMRAALRKAYEAYEPSGVRDPILINGVDPTRSGCALYVFRAKCSAFSQGSGNRSLASQQISPRHTACIDGWIGRSMRC
ncbi:MAG: hypothetical protein ABIW76_06945 [Fibrobacteria bacterium]